MVATSTRRGRAALVPTFATLHAILHEPSDNFTRAPSLVYTSFNSILESAALASASEVTQPFARTGTNKETSADPRDHINVESMESLSIGANDKQQVTANTVNVFEETVIVRADSWEYSRHFPGCSILKRHVHSCRKP